MLVPVRNGEAYIAKAIESVLSQSWGDFVLIVSNNASTDRTAEVVSGFLGDQRVQLVHQPASDALGMIAHFNRCLDLVESQYYFLLCHDDFLNEANALAEAHEILEKNPAVSSVYCDLSYVDEMGLPILARRFRPRGTLSGEHLARRSLVTMRNLFGIPLLVRTAALRSQRYDESLKYAADLDLAIAMAQDDAIFHIDRTLIANRYHGTNSTRGLFRQAMFEMKRIAVKRGIDLTSTECLAMSFCAAKVSAQKWVFFQYLAIRAMAKTRKPRAIDQDQGAI